MLKLDDRDLKILAILREEGRISKSELARRVNLTAAPCWERLKRLEQAGIITGYRAEVALKKITPHVVVFMAAELEHHRAENFQVFERAVGRHDEVVACWAVGGGFDYILQIIARDIDAYQRLVDDLLDAKVGLARYFTYVVTKQVKLSAKLPLSELVDLPTEKE
ncbi:Lrp/AsnC family transcriptional regulator [Nitratireductor mangrovi]|uniref:Lrp/AsnC family transcriptional regulator n=1 Tax=Nitratireductor mangrovi TaxID=2599600 RepID=A0A5B8L3W4_9HYPH|nr:Lrp/AsnC family transcriptional regulator [Nitratireductor mangrovi]QDZ02656.1 Lrp/AsnC family transcriptional regulator [Nitratireductor mangrovi]